MKKKRKTLKGISLVELVVVMAVFGLIMSTALAMIKPVSDQYNTTAQFTSANASIDSISFYLESQLRYADRLWVYKNYKQGSTAESISYSDMVSQFSSEYCLVPTTKTFNIGVAPDVKEYSATIDRTAVDPALASNYYIYIMTIHNDKDCTIDGSTEPRGRVSIDVYEPDGTYVATKSNEYAVAEGFYKNNEFEIRLGEAQRNEDGVWTKDVDGKQIYGPFNPGNFATTISIYKKQFDKSAGTFVWNDTNLKNVASFAIMNLTNPDNIVYKLSNVRNKTDHTVFDVQYDDFKQPNYGYNYNVNAESSDTWLLKSNLTAARYKEIACNGTLSDGSEAQDIVFVYTKPKTFK